MGIAYTWMGQKEKAREYLEAAKVIFEGMDLEHMVRKVEQMMESAGPKS